MAVDLTNRTSPTFFTIPFTVIRAILLAIGESNKIWKCFGVGDGCLTKV